MDRLTSLEVFNKVVESASFSEAARQLGLSRA
ncbi:MAG: LysR family transcriptional regulator, partial [Pseudomonadota bacterium]